MKGMKSKIGVKGVESCIPEGNTLRHKHIRSSPRAARLLTSLLCPSHPTQVTNKIGCCQNLNSIAWYRGVIRNSHFFRHQRILVTRFWFSPIYAPPVFSSLSSLCCLPSLACMSQWALPYLWLCLHCPPLIQRGLTRSLFKLEFVAS